MASLPGERSNDELGNSSMQPVQLDIFDHSFDTMRRNDVVHAIERRDAIAARSAWRLFGREFPGDETLAPLGVLVNALESRVSKAFLDHDALCHARRVMDNEIEPAAARMLGEKAGAVWLAPLWQELAQRAAHAAYIATR